MSSTRSSRCLTAATAALVLVGTAACGAEEPGTAAAPPSSAPPAATGPVTPSPAASPQAPTAPPADAPVSLDTSSPQVLATGLEVPWGLAFLPDGDALVTERETARVLRVPAAGGEPQVVTTVRDADPAGEGGLLGIALSPEFAADELVYVYVTTGEDNRVVRFPLSAPDDVEPVLTGIPKGTIHNGGRIAFGPDGLLHVGTGDTGDTSLSQDDDSLGGKVLRVTADGEPAGTGGSPVLSKGHRNVQGLAFDAAGRLYAVEFGQNRFDEVNQVSEGSNGGWPEVEGADDGGGRYLAPVATWETSEASPSGAAVVGDVLYVAALRGRRLWQVPLDGAGGAGEPTSVLDGEFGRLRTAQQAPDGSLWLMTSNRDGRGEPVDEDDRILRLAAQ